nr:tail fiber assembly protein [Limnobaculum xujianqingii]
MFYYSKEMNAFYLADGKDNYLSAGTWPADAVGVSLDIFNEFSDVPPEGKIRVAGQDGLPKWQDIPPLTKEQSIEFAEVEKSRQISSVNNYINSKQWPGKAAIGRLKDDELMQYNLWLDYLDALEAIDIIQAPDIKWPQKP